MEEAAQVGPASREENHPQSLWSNIKSRRILIAIGAVVLLIIVLVSVIISFSSKNPLTENKGSINDIPEVLRENTLSNEAKGYFTELAATSLKPQYIPSNITIDSVTNEKGEIIAPNDYTGTWPVDNLFGNFSVSFRDVGIVNTSIIEMILPYQINNLNITTAATDSARYYIVQPKGAWVCKEITLGRDTFTQCENFWIDTNSTKKGLGIIASPKSNAYYCEIYPTSKKYSQSNCFGF